MPGTPVDPKNGSVQEKHLQSTRLDMPVIGMESEFNVWLDEVEIDPKPFWEHPAAFIDRPLLPREKTSLQLPTGGGGSLDPGGLREVAPGVPLPPGRTAPAGRDP